MKAIAIEDNPSAVSVLETYLQDYPRDIDWAGHASDIEKGRTLIEEAKPDLVFLDIHLGEHEVFALFDDWQPDPSVQIIFITAYIESDYILQALRQSAVDYLVKPLDRDEFFAALDKVFQQKPRHELETRLAALEEALYQVRSQNLKNIKLPFHCLNGSIEYIALSDWICIYTEDGILRARFADGSIRATSKTLKEMEAHLCSDFPFQRISLQMIINLHHLTQYQPQRRRVVLSNGGRFKVSRRRVSDLLDALKK